MLLTRVNSGLDGIVVADTAMSEVDGEAGRLIVRGHAIEELTETRGFEGVAALLWEGYAAGGGDEAAVAAGLAAARVQAFAAVPKLLAATRGLNPVEADNSFLPILTRRPAVAVDRCLPASTTATMGQQE